MPEHPPREDVYENKTKQQILQESAIILREILEAENGIQCDVLIERIDSLTEKEIEYHTLEMLRHRVIAKLGEEERIKITPGTAQLFEIIRASPSIGVTNEQTRP